LVFDVVCEVNKGTELGLGLEGEDGEDRYRGCGLGGSEDVDSRRSISKVEIRLSGGNGEDGLRLNGSAGRRARGVRSGFWSPCVRISLGK